MYSHCIRIHCPTAPMHDRTTHYTYRHTHARTYLHTYWLWCGERELNIQQKYYIVDVEYRAIWLLLLLLLTSRRRRMPRHSFVYVLDVCMLLLCCCCCVDVRSSPLKIIWHAAWLTKSKSDSTIQVIFTTAAHISHSPSLICVRNPLNFRKNFFVFFCLRNLYKYFFRLDFSGWKNQRE